MPFTAFNEYLTWPKIKSLDMGQKILNNYQFSHPKP